MNTSEQDRLALADIVALERGRAVALVIVRLSVEDGQKLEQILRAPAATDTAGAVERMRGALSGLIFYAELLEHLVLDAADRGVNPVMQAARAALPLPPADPAAGDGGGR